jgi:hypothetical protein
VRAERTAGGHYRIAESELLALRSPSRQQAAATAPRPRRRHFQYCWEFNSGPDGLQPQCPECAVYQMRAYRCYEVLKLAPEAGHARLFCVPSGNKSCAECDYYNKVHKQPANVLVVTDNELLTAALQRDAAAARFNLEVTHCEYTCSALIERFRPDFAIVDCSLGPERATDIARHMAVDPRIPYVRMILAAREGGFPTECDKEVFARILTPFSVDDIADCLGGILDDWRQRS